MEELLLPTPSFDSSPFLNLPDPALFDELDMSALIAQSEHAGIEFHSHDLIPEIPSQALEESSEGTETTPHGSPLHPTIGGEVIDSSAIVDPNLQKLISEYGSLAAQPQSPAVSSPSLHSTSASGSSSSEENEKPGKRSRGKGSGEKARGGSRRKKPRASSIENIPLEQVVVEGVTLKEEFLLTCSLADYETLISRITANRPSLNSTEEHTVIQQRRRVKNRESAQESRDKKKNQVNELQHEIESLRDVNDNLSSENAQLRANVQRLERMLSMHDAIVNTWNSFAHIGSNKRTGAASAATTGVLLIVLLSFGVLFPQLTAPITRGLSSGPVRVFQDHHSFIPVCHPSSSSSGVGRARTLLEVPDSSPQMPILSSTTTSHTGPVITEHQLNATVCALIRSGQYDQPLRYTQAEALRLCESQA